MTDTRRVKDESVGPAAKVSTSTLKPKGGLPKAKAAPKRNKKAQAAAEQAAIDKALDKQGPVKQLPLDPEEPAVVSASSDELEPVDRDDAWCGICGGMLYAGPSGDVCRLGHGEPPTLTWERAASHLYDQGVHPQDAARGMGAEPQDMVVFYAELDARDARDMQPGKTQADALIRTAEEAGAAQSFRNGATFEAVERFYGQVLGTERLRELFEEAATCSWCGEPHLGGPEKCPVAQPVVAPDFLPANFLPTNMQAAMSGHGMHEALPAPGSPDNELRAAEVDDAQQMQPVFGVGDIVTPVCLIESSMGLLWAPGERLTVRRVPAPAYEVEDANGGRALADGTAIRHFTEARTQPQAQVDAAWQRWVAEYARANLPRAEELPHAGPALEGRPEPTGKSWLELQLGAAPLSAAEYERIGRLWVGALAAGVDIQTWAMREREVLATVRTDILGTHG